jgi:hypothetical protein
VQLILLNHVADGEHLAVGFYEVAEVHFGHEAESVIDDALHIFEE